MRIGKLWSTLLTAFTANKQMDLSARRYAPSAERNQEPIRNALARVPPWSGSEKVDALEIASGTGQHCAFFAEFFPHVTIWPTEFGGGSAGPEADAYGSLAPVFASIESYSAQLANVRKPIELDAGAAAWPEEIEETRFGAVYACNVCHISPYAVTEGILAGASRVLAPSGGLFLYGPFMVDGAHTAPSNAEFDVRLRAQNSEWGVRDSTAIARAAALHGLQLVDRVQMPANNLLLYFQKQ